MDRNFEIVAAESPPNYLRKDALTALSANGMTTSKVLDAFFR